MKVRNYIIPLILTLLTAVWSYSADWYNPPGGEAVEAQDTDHILIEQNKVSRVITKGNFLKGLRAEVFDNATSSSAQGAANSAANSATSAASSAAQASTYANQASTAAGNAAAAAVTAGTHATNAANSASTAATLASQVSTNAASASASASAAANSATTAGTSASAAATSAITASTKATEAASSATAAQTAKLAAESIYLNARINTQGLLFVAPLAELYTGYTGSPESTTELSGPDYEEVTNTAGNGGGKAISVVGSHSLANRKAVSVSATRRYRATVVVRKVVNDSGTVNATVRELNSSYTSVTSPSIVSNEAIVANMGWKVYILDFTPAAGVKFARIQVGVNLGSTGKSEIAEMSIEDITESNNAATHASAAATHASTASTKATEAAGYASASSTNATSAAASAGAASGYASTAQTAASTADTAANRYAAQYTIKVNANGKIAGFGLFADNTTGSRMEFTADAITIASGKTGPTSTTTGYWLGSDSGTPKFSIGSTTNFLKWDGTNLTIASGKTTSTSTTTGYFLGNESGVPKFSIGSATKYLKWDGNALTYTGNIGDDRIIRGRVASAGTITSGAGYTITKLGAGKYRVNFTDAFSAIPTIVATPDYNTGESITAAIYSVSASSATVYVTVQDGSFRDLAFSFIAVGAD